MFLVRARITFGQRTKSFFYYLNPLFNILIYFQSPWTLTHIHQMNTITHIRRFFNVIAIYWWTDSLLQDSRCHQIIKNVFPKNHEISIQKYVFLNFLECTLSWQRIFNVVLTCMFSHVFYYFYLSKFKTYAPNFFPSEFRTKLMW